MPLALSANPLFIAGIVRCGGVVTARVTGHGFNNTHVGQSIRVSGVSDPTYNGTFTISAVPDGNTIKFLQSSVNDNHAEISGGAISVG